MSTLDDLKRAIAAIPNPESTNPGAWYAVSLRARAEAWRKAFEWRDEFGCRPMRDCPCKSCREECAEYDEGMALIREKLS